MNTAYARKVVLHFVWVRFLCLEETFSWDDTGWTIAIIVHRSSRLITILVKWESVESSRKAQSLHNSVFHHGWRDIRLSDVAKNCPFGRLGIRPAQSLASLLTEAAAFDSIKRLNSVDINTLSIFCMLDMLPLTEAGCWHIHRCYI